MAARKRLGLIGAGMYGKVLLRSFAREGRAEIAWACSATEESARAAAAEFGIPRWTTDYREMLADPALDAVLIATPPYLHAEQVEAALEAGKDILLEKPMASSPAEIARILSSAEEHPERILLEASCRHARLTPKFRLIKGIIDSGRIGRVYHLHQVSLTRGTFIEWNPKGAWAMDRKLAGGGPLVDWGVYDLSFHLGLLGDAHRLGSSRGFSLRGLRDLSALVDFTDVEQHAAAWMDFDGGLSYYYERGAGVHGEAANETRIQGTKGGLRFSYPSWESPEIELIYDEGGQARKEVLRAPAAVADAAAGTAADSDSQALAAHFMDCLEGKAKPAMTAALAAKHLEILFGLIEGTRAV